MLTRKIDKYLDNYFKDSRNALLITGARQVGKTYSIRNFGQSFECFIEINFIEHPEASAIFENVSGVNDILLRLSAFTSKNLIKGKTLIFFDEVQRCPELITAIKFLVDEGSYRYILSGSLLGIELNDVRSVPVGYMGVKEMYPLDFEEFVTCLGVGNDVIESIRNAWLKRIEVDSFLHTKLMQLFRLYLVVGGMPAAVDKYIETNNLQNVMTLQKDIITLYKRDIAQYDKDDKLKIEEIFSLIPSELNAKNKRFILKSLNQNARMERYLDSFLWLKDAGVALPVYNVEEPKAPLLLSRSRNLFKLFQNDVGLLAAQYAEGIQLKILNGDNNINFGSVYENMIAQELTAHGFGTYYYNNKKRGEIDFVIENNGEVTLLEIKSGKDYEFHRALSNILSCEEYHFKDAIVFNNDNMKVKNGVAYAPIYMIMFVVKNESCPLIYKSPWTGM